MIVINITSKESNLYKKENPTKDKGTDITGAPAKIKELLWLWGFVKKYPIIGIVSLALSTMYFSKDYIYEQNKHPIHVNLLHTKVPQEEKVKLKHIFMSGGSLVNLFHEMRDRQFNP